MNADNQLNHANPGTESCQIFGLHRDKVDSGFHDPYIVNGYRKPNISAKDCLRSTFIYHCNETINVWSHFIAFLYFFVHFINHFTTKASLTDPFQWPFVTYSIGTQGFCLMSALAHTFNSISPKARNICFSLDYAAISIYAVGAGQAFFFYSRPINPPVEKFTHYFIFSIGSILFSVASTVQCCFTRHKQYSYRYVARTLSYVMPFLWNTSPFLYRLVTCRDGYDSTSFTSAPFYFHGGLYVVAAIINCARVPERLIVGVFCVIGQSHHWMHVLTAIGAAVQLEGVRVDMLDRQSVLKKLVDQSESSYCLLFMCVAVVTNFASAFWLGCCTPAETLNNSENELKNTDDLTREKKKND